MSAERVLIGLRDRLITDAFDLLLGEAGFVVSTCCCDPAVLVERARCDEVDIIVVGSDVFDTDGASPVLEQLGVEAPSTRVVVLLRDGDACVARSAVRYEVKGVIPASAGTAECLGILQQVLDGNVVYPGWLLTRLAASPAPATAVLSDRQREVLEHLSLGRSNDEIARRLFISRNTVKFHLREIYVRLGVRNRVEATRAAHDALAAAPSPEATARRAHPR